MPARTETQLLERAAELVCLHELVAEASAGRGRLVVVEGAAGAGKSTLVAAACTLAASEGARVLTASGSELEREFAFGAIRQLFEPVLATLPASQRERLLAGAAAPAAWVIEPVDETASPARPDAGFAALHAIYWLAANVAEQTPLLIAVDDLHWVDESSVRSLIYVARRIADVPIALLVALRSDEPGAPAALLDELLSLRESETIVPAALSAVAVTELVRERVPDASDDLATAFHSASGGNPLYLQELLRTLTGSGAITATAVQRASIPTLGDRVNRRIARVAPQAAGLTAAMAVLGDGSRLALAAALARVAKADAARIAQQLVRIEVLAAEDPFAFVHPLVRRSVYDGLSTTERDAAHIAAADLLRAAGAPVESVAVHLAAVRPAGSAMVTATLAEAADAAVTRAAPDAAIRFLRRALAEEGAAPSRASLLFDLGRDEMVQRDPASIGHLQEALELAADPDLRGRVALVLTEILCAAGQWEAATAIMETAQAELGEAIPELVIELSAFRAVTLAYDPRLVEQFDRERALFEALAEGDSWPAHALSVLLACVAGFRGEGRTKVLALLERGLRDGRLIRERGGGAWATAQALSACIMVDEYERALELAAQVDAEARRTGALLPMLTGPGYRGWVATRRGDLAAAEAELRIVADLVTQSGMLMWVTTMFYMFSDAISERPSLDDIAAIREGMEFEPVFLATGAGAMLTEARGVARLARNDRGGALDDLRAAGETYVALGVGPAQGSWRSTLALATAPDSPEEARALVAEELALARASGLARPHGVALRTAGVLEGGETGIELLRESIALLESSEARLEHARTLVELGAALRRRQKRGQAREQLEAGMELAYRCGAPRLVARAEDELRAAGARPRRPVRSGADALTASELRVAQLAADGRSNREIAQSLYVTLKTVETHLSHAYTKLGLAGQGARKRLADALS